MDKPNVLLITSDQQHWSTLGVLNAKIKTPNLDRLAKLGMLFERAYTVNPTCTPTRASIITGLYPSQHGAWALGTKSPENIHTIGEDFAEAGYDTALVGKAHFQPLKETAGFSSLESYPILQDLDFWREFDGPFYGFRQVELARNHADEAHVGQHYALWLEAKGLENWRDHFQKPTGRCEPQEYQWSLPEKYHYGYWIAEKSCQIIEENVKQAKPFFLWSSFLDPHPPYLVPTPWDELYNPAELDLPQIQPDEHLDSTPEIKLTQEENPDYSAWKESGEGIHGCHSHLIPSEKQAKNMAVYYGMISLMDKQIGIILDKIESCGQQDNTIIIFTTDHGHFFGQHGLTAKGPFHYEDAIKIPFIVSYPSCIPANLKSQALQSIIDIPVTLSKFCGLKGAASMTGIDQSEVWNGNKTELRKHVIVENRHEPTTIHIKTLVEQKYKITVYFERQYGEIYDIIDDPEEITNLWDSAEHNELKNKLILKLLHAEMGKEYMWMPRIATA